MYPAKGIRRLKLNRYWIATKDCKVAISSCSAEKRAGQNRFSITKAFMRGRWSSSHGVRNKVTQVTRWMKPNAFVSKYLSKYMSPWKTTQIQHTVSYNCSSPSAPPFQSTVSTAKSQQFSWSLETANRILPHTTPVEYKASTNQAYSFFRKEHPSINLALPPVGWHKTLAHDPQMTTVWACEKTVVMLKHPGHFTSCRMLERRHKR